MKEFAFNINVISYYGEMLACNTLCVNMRNNYL